MNLGAYDPIFMSEVCYGELKTSAATITILKLMIFAVLYLGMTIGGKFVKRLASSSEYC